MTRQELLQRLQTEAPDYWAWLQSKENALSKVKSLAGSVSQWSKFFTAIQGLKSYATFTSGQNTDDGEEEVVEDELPDSFFEDTGDDLFAQQQAEAEAREGQNVLDQLSNFLIEQELPMSLLGFIQGALAKKWSFSKIVAELRLTPEYEAAYPEMKLRRQAGFAPMTEAEIRSYRGEARRLAVEYFGVNLSQQEITGLLTKDKSLREYEQDLKTLREMERWGPAVKQVLAGELGYLPDDDLVFRFLHAEHATPEIDRAYQRALLRGQPAAIGLGIRPEEEADILQAYGISPEQAFRGYENILGETSRAERYAAIEAEIGRNIANFPTGEGLFNGTPFATLFRAIQLQDPEALAKMQSQLSREVARFQAGGGIAQSGTGAAIGLLTPDERAQR
jgi:hypothetical protein